MYSLKSRFQALLQPIKYKLVRSNIKPNHITMATCALCLLYSAWLAWSTYTIALLLLLPVLMLVRMALNALDGMVAEATDNKTPEGAVLNEVCDVVADAALLSAFLVLLTGVQAGWWLLTVFCLLTEFVSLAVYQACGVRPHSGPLGKSDRAVYLGLLAILLVAFPAAISTSPIWLIAYIGVGVALSALTIWNRFQAIAIKPLP